MTAARGNGQAPASSAAAGSRPFDLEAAAAAEMARAPFPFEFPKNSGKVYEVPAQQCWPVEALEWLSEGELRPAFNAIVGEEKYAAMKADGLKMGHINALMAAVADYSGMSLPNSSGPRPPASART